jgi:hypothetical protein
MIGKNKNIFLKKGLENFAAKKVILSQYESSLLMLINAVAKCDNDLWLNKEYTTQYWHVCYHTLFYTDLYLSTDEYSFTPWIKHKKEYQFLGNVPYQPYHKPVIEEAYSQSEIHEYLESIFEKLGERLANMNLGDTSGFFWLPFSKLELQLYNIRHIQHHTGQLIERLREQKDIAVEWISYASINE